MLKKFKKGVKRVMKEVKDCVNDSLASRVYENTREDPQNIFSDDLNTRKLGILFLGIAVSLIVNSYMK